MDALIQQFFNLDIMARSLPLVLQGLQQTVLLCLIVIPLGLIGGLIFALASLSGSRTVRWGMIVAIDFFRAVPPLVLHGTVTGSSSAAPSSVVTRIDAVTLPADSATVAVSAVIVTVTFWRGVTLASRREPR